ncbi:alkylation response protein AidB-like acyl-CoA dehydrogenase [Variovorax sp. TBS-050B]|uniref:acyl-CoA dehydrogenase family protein n=1 Tax=Variovorax sp. TBS-050B TaxID=2940551 RepID=UPI0024752CAE|nr:acyl-CoA dehydrogenase family protein [Variovorax sp. TBS-050B]MDH6593372.1 alkylation response protein AidB-like acyl-CoA dehydrogenase [Variovorax sp. TBS-050B]
MSALPLRRPSAAASASSSVSSAPPAVDDALLARLSAQFASTAADHDRSGAFPHANFELLQAHGLIGLVAPAALGGGGATLATARRVIAAVARGEPATALILTMTWLQHHALGRGDSRWPAPLRERVLRDAVAHGALINSLRVEPVLGSPARGGLPATVARREGGQWRISGHKLYTTGIEGLSWLAVWARTDEPAPRTGIVLVPRRAPGVRVIASWDHLGLRASGSHEVVFEDVAVPLDHAVDLRAPAAWAADAGSQTDIDAHAAQQAWMVVLLGSLYDAVAQAARDWLVDFLNQRAPGSLGAPLASLPRVQEHVGEIEALLRTNRVLLDEAARAVDEGHAPAAADSGLAKYTVTNNAIRAVEIALQLSGNHGLARQNPLERHHRDVLCGRIHTPQNDAVLIAAGRRALNTQGAAA